MKRIEFGIYKNKRLRTTGPLGSTSSVYNLRMPSDLYEKMIVHCHKNNEDVCDFIVKQILIALHQIKNGELYHLLPDLSSDELLNKQQRPNHAIPKPTNMNHYLIDYRDVTIKEQDVIYYNFKINGNILHKVKDLHRIELNNKVLYASIDKWINKQIKLAIIKG